MKRRMLVLAALGGIACACPALAQAPSPISPELDPFPGAVMGTTSAASAGMAFADHWLGDEPFGNPAVAPRRGVWLSPLVQRVSRQDLRAHNRQFDDTYEFDASGGWVGLPAGRVAISAYAWQPVLRLEDIAFVRGEEGDPPAVVGAQSTAREVRAGLGVSIALGASWRAGVAGEWTRRDDDYQYLEQSGDPGAGTRQATLSGDGVGVAVGLRGRFALPGERSLTLGAAFHSVPALDLTGDQVLHLAAGDSTASLSTRRGGSWDGGASAAVGVTPAVRVLVAIGLGGAQRYTPGTSAGVAFGGLEAGAATQWTVGFEYAEPEAPLQIRAGAGQEVQTGVPEPRSGVYALGFGWQFDPNLRLDLSLLRRTIARAARATSYDDRLVGTVGVRF